MTISHLTGLVVAILFLIATGTAASETVTLTVTNPHAVDLSATPVTSGVPFPRGALRSVDNVRLLRDGVEVPAQFRVTGRWEPGPSVRWLLVDFQADVDADSRQSYTLEYGYDVIPKVVPPGVRLTRLDDAYRVDTGAAAFRINTRRFTLFDAVTLADGTALVTPPASDALPRGAVIRGLQPTVTRGIPDPDNQGRAHLIYVSNLDSSGENFRLRYTSDMDYEVVGSAGPVGAGRYREDFQSDDGAIAIPADAWLNGRRPRKGDAFTFTTVAGRDPIWSETVTSADVVESGPLRTVLRLKGTFGPPAAPVMEYTAWYHFTAGASDVKLSFTLENNDHGGRTDTGNADNADIGGVNCVFFDEMALELPVDLTNAATRLLGDHPSGFTVVDAFTDGVSLYQDSNGGDTWDRYRDEKYHPRPNSYVTFRGYRIEADGRQVGNGDRAAGLLAVDDGTHGLAVTVADFWQNFPKQLAVTSSGRVRVGLFPGRYAGPFPFRSGEHKTHDVLFSFEQEPKSAADLETTAAVFSTPLRAEPSPAWFAKAGALGYIYPVDNDAYPDYEAFNRSTIGRFPDGREPGLSLLSRREEYDMYGWMDYGDVPIDFESGTGQWGMKYDLDHHMARQYARSLDPRWWSLFTAAARHAGDIDVHHQPHYPELHFVKGGVWAHSLHNEPGHRNPNRNYNHFTKDLSFGARGTADLHYLTGDWKAYEACLEMAENAFAEYMSPQEAPDPSKRNRMGWRGDACTLNRLLEGYLLTGEQRYIDRARWVIRDCAFNGRPDDHGPISLWSSTFYMMALARYVDLFPDDTDARSYLLAHLETLDRACQGETCMLYTITPQPDGSVTGEGTTSMYNIMGADALALAYRMTGDLKYLETARRCIAYGIGTLPRVEGAPSYYQVHTANGAMHGSLYMSVEEVERVEE